jgi:DNA polymerase elongation subunit (family B)
MYNIHYITAEIINNFGEETIMFVLLDIYIWHNCTSIALYPSSMISENISHDTIINEDEVEYYEE